MFSGAGIFPPKNFKAVEALRQEVLVAQDAASVPDLHVVILALTRDCKVVLPS